MSRAALIVGVTLLVAIPLGGLGAWAFNPDSGALLHSEVLWSIFGIMCEGGMLLTLGLLLVSGLVAVVRKMLGICRTRQA